MCALPLLIGVLLQAAAVGTSADALWKIWPDERFVTTPAPCVRPAELATELRRLAELYPDRLRLTELGSSFRGRPIHLVTLGHGARKVLLWSQMHGDEASATPALLDVTHFLLSHADEPDAATILDELTLLMIPMLNPDGAEVFERRNAQGIDINRDTLNLATPEGRILKRVRDQYEPMLGFNLHDQNPRTTVGNSGVLATIALLAVAGDEEQSVSPGRLRSKRACAAIAKALTRYVPGGIARFDEEWNPRAFGDNITAWGTPVVLIESGGLPPDRPVEDLTRLNFVAMLQALRDLARDDLQGHDPRVYDALERNRRNSWADVVVRGGYMTQAPVGPAYRADLAFDLAADRRDVACRTDAGPPRSSIVEIGDARIFGAGRVVDASGALLLAPFVAGVGGWSARRWLGGELLTELARLGVGTVLWQVPRRKLAVAQRLAAELSQRGRARLQVVQAPAERPWLHLSGPPLQPASDSLADVVKALLGPRQAAERSLPPSLAALTNAPSSRFTGPTPRVGGPASFVLLTPAEEGRIDLATARVTAVFIDGVELKGARQ
jgi:hypothetical protein